MGNKYLYLIPLTLVEIILQLAFFWLAPDVPCYWVVYAFGTVMTLIHIGVTFAVGSTHGVRKGTATVIAGSTCMCILIITGCVLLASGASVRNSIFALLIASMIYAVIVTFLVFSIETTDSLSTPIRPSLDDEYEYNDEDREERQPLEAISANMKRSGVPVSVAPISSGVTPPPLPIKR